MAAWDDPDSPPKATSATASPNVIVGLITAVLLLESNGAVVAAGVGGGRAVPELWPLGTEALAMEVSALEAKRLGHRAVPRLSWLLLVTSVARSTLLQVAVASPTA